MAHPILEAQDALKALLAARTAFTSTSTEVRDGGPTEGEDVKPSAFWFTDVTVPEEGWGELGAAAGGNRRRSRFNIGFTIMVRTYGDDERSTRAATLALYEDLQATVKANPALGVPAWVQTTGPVTGTLSSAPISSQEWAAWFTGSLAVTSRLY